MAAPLRSTRTKAAEILEMKRPPMEHTEVSQVRMKVPPD
jgi:hypothetical protein